MRTADFLDHALSDDVVRQAAEGLCADDIRNAALDQLEHLAGQEPALAGLVSERCEILREIRQMLYAGVRMEALRLFQRAVHGSAEPVNDSDHEIAAPRHLFIHAEVLRAEVVIIQRIVKEIEEVKHRGFRAFTLQQVDEIVIRKRREFDKDLTDDADFRFLHIFVDRQLVEFSDDLAYILIESVQMQSAFLQFFAELFLPLPVKLIRGSGNQFVRTDPVQNAHEDIAVENRHERLYDQFRSHLKAAVLLDALEGDAEHRDVPEAGFFHGPANEADVIRRTASASGLEHRHSASGLVISAGGQSADDLADDDDRRVARVVVHVLQAGVDCLAVRVL